MARRSVAIALVLTVSIALGGCTTPPPRADPPPMPDPASTAIRMAAVGDSITDGDSRDFSGGVPGPQSWVSHAVGSQIEFVGGWAQWGASVEAMADAVTQPFDADVLVILAGTNDAGWMPHDQITAALERIAENADVERVVLSSIPPNDLATRATAELNRSLEAYAEDVDWTWVDAAAGVRDGDRYAEGMSYDGVHPTEAGAAALGEAIASAVIGSFSGG